MARKLIILMIAIIFVGLIAIPMKTAEAQIEPDIVTDKVIFIGPAFSTTVVSNLKNGVLGIVSYVEPDHIGFDVPGGNIGTDLIINASGKGIVPTTPVGLKLVNGDLYVYISKVEVIVVRWNILSIPPDELSFGNASWFPKFIPLQILKAIPNGVETHINYCCNPPVKTVSYGYKLYLSIPRDPYNPPEELSGELILYLNKYFMVEVMIPDYLIPDFETLIKNNDCVWVGLSGSSFGPDYNYVYFWH